MIKVKRIYDRPSKDDGYRVLVDRLWPRGLTKEKAKIDLWVKEIAPSDSLRKWYSHDPRKWERFREKYSQELEARQDVVNLIIHKMKEEDVTLLYSSKEDKFNNAMALKAWLEEDKRKWP